MFSLTGSCDYISFPLFSDFYKLPSELRIFAAFLRAMGVRDSFQTVDYVDVLNSMATVYGSSSSGVKAAPAASSSSSAAAAGSKVVAAPSSSSAAKPLSARDLDTAITIVQFLSDHASEIQSTIFVPTEQCTLALAPSLVFQDAQWLETKRRADVTSKKQQQQLFVHPKLSNAVAEKVGVKSWRATLLSSMAESIGLSDAGSSAAASLGSVAFGQKESLVQRLKNILALYPEGVGVLYELLQNADDAKAEEMTLMFNADSYGTSSLLSQKMEAWQGPALYCWNSAQFSEQDYNNLATIGQGSKLDKLAATGRFGLGFNAVFHFTDLPSIVSGSYIAYFDPHATNLPNVSHREPGLRIPLSPRLLESFPDQFSPYLFFGCELHSEYKSTLFRFPLRTDSTARASGIKREVTSRKDMLGLLESFRAVVVEAMLFLRHIKKIQVMVHENGNTRVLFGAELKDPNQRSKGVWAQIPAFAGGKAAAVAASSSSSSSNASNTNAAAVAAALAASQLSKSSFYKRLESCQESDLQRGFQVANIQLSKFEYTESKPEDPPTSSDDPNALPPPPAGPLFTLRSSSVTTETFLLSEQLGWGASRMMACEGAKRGLKMINFGGVSAHILHNGHPVSMASSAALGGKAFCFLPLPVTTGLPINLNAFFELSANRRDIWWGSEPFEATGTKPCCWTWSHLRTHGCSWALQDCSARHHCSSINSSPRKDCPAVSATPVRPQKHGRC